MKYFNSVQIQPLNLQMPRESISNKNFLYEHEDRYILYSKIREYFTLLLGEKLKQISEFLMGQWCYLLSNSILLLCVRGNMRCLGELMNIQGALFCNDLQLIAAFIHIHLSKA